MAEMETLDSLLGPGPAAADNPAAEAGQTGSDSSEASRGASAGASATVEQRIAELESKLQRTTEQYQGSSREALAQKARADELERTTQTLASRLETLAQPPAPTTTADPIPSTFLTKLSGALGYEPTVAEAQAAWQAAKEALQPATQPPQPSQPEGQYLTRQDLADFATRQTQQQTAIQAVLGQHPELNDAGYLQHVIQEYDALRQDPMTSTLYPEAQEGPNVVQFGGRTFDLRLIDKATTAYKMKAAQVAEQHNGPTLEGGNPVPNGAKPKSPVIPTAYVNEGGIFRDPTVMRALVNAGWGGNTRQQVEKMLQHLSPAQRAEWEAQQRG